MESGGSLVNRLPYPPAAGTCRFCAQGPPIVEEPLYAACRCPLLNHLSCILQYARISQTHLCPICRTPFRGVRVQRTSGGCGGWLRDDQTGRQLCLRLPMLLFTLYLLTLLGHLQRVSAHHRTAPLVRHLLKYWVYVFVYLSIVCTFFAVVLLLERYLSWRRHHQQVEVYAVAMQADGTLRTVPTGQPPPSPQPPPSTGQPQQPSLATPSSHQA